MEDCPDQTNGFDLWKEAKAAEGKLERSFHLSVYSPCSELFHSPRCRPVGLLDAEASHKRCLHISHQNQWQQHTGLSLNKV